MKREWQPGDVAMVAGQVALRLAYEPATCPGNHAFGGDHWHLADGHWICDSSVAHENARPLVVIDPEDREQVERLLLGYLDRAFRGMPKDAPIRTSGIDYLQAALREFANPKPPKPEEPTGLGAVVRLADGTRWIRYAVAGEWWFNADSPATGLRWGDLDVVEVLTEGVQS